MQMQHCRERVLQLLSCAADASAIDRAAHNLASNDPRLRSYALEVLDIQTPVALKPVVLPVLEDLVPAERLRRLQPNYPQVPMDRQTRLTELGSTGGGQLSAARLHGHGLLREACLQLRGLGGDRQVPGQPEVALVSAGGGPAAACLILTAGAR